MDIIRELTPEQKDYFAEFNFDFHELAKELNEFVRLRLWSEPCLTSGVFNEHALKAFIVNHLCPVNLADWPRDTFEPEEMFKTSRLDEEALDRMRG